MFSFTVLPFASHAFSTCADFASASCASCGGTSEPVRKLTTCRFSTLATSAAEQSSLNDENALMNDSFALSTACLTSKVPMVKPAPNNDFSLSIQPLRTSAADPLNSIFSPDNLASAPGNCISGNRPSSLSSQLARSEERRVG